MAGEPIIEIYMQYFRQDNAIVSTETLIQTVPYSGEPVMTNPRVKAEMGKAGSFEFDMEMPSPYYDAVLQMKTMFRVVYFGHTIFRGRALTIDKKMARTRTVHCEGDFAFLLDSHQIAVKEDVRPEITVLEYLQELITQHNADMTAEPHKKFVLGEVPGQYTAATDESQRVVIPEEKEKQQFGDNSWNSTMDRLESLLSDFGGFFRTRYDAANDVAYLDWLDKYYNASLNAQQIEVAKNLIDLSGPTEVENLFTVVVPIGKAKSGGENVYISDYWPIAAEGHEQVNYIMVPELATIPLFTDAELNVDYHRKEDYQNAINRFGYIWKPVDFDNADTPEKLFTYAIDWIRNSYMPEVTQWDVTALDLKILDSGNQVLLCGDRIPLSHPEVDPAYDGLTAISADLDLYSPDKNKYTIGIPNREINTSYGVKNKTDGKGSGASLSSTNTKISKEPRKTLEELRDELQFQYVLKTETNTDIRLDEPLAFIAYDTHGNEADEKDVAKKSAEVASKFRVTKLLHGTEIAQEALRRRVSIDDPQLLIDFTPDLKEEQTTWKRQSGFYYTHILGLRQQETDLLLNDSAGRSWMACLVDDDGNWTQEAYKRGIPMLATADEIKAQAINTRDLYTGKKTSKNATTISSAFDYLVGDGLNIGDNVLDVVTTVEENLGNLKTDAVNMLGQAVSFISEEKEKSQGTGTWEERGFNILDTILGNNTESEGKEVSVESDTLELDGTTGGGSGALGIGKLGGRKVTFNRISTYTSAYDQQQKTVPAGAVAADDFHITDMEFESLKAKVIVTDQIITGKVDADTIKADIAYLRNINGDSIVANTQVSAATIRGSRVFSDDFILNVQGGSSSPSGESHLRDCFKYLLVTQAGGDFRLTFARADNSSFVEDIDISGTDFPSLTASDFILKYGQGSTSHLGDCYKGCSASESEGVITLTFTKADGTTATTNFNMADTQFFQDAISAAKDLGWNDSRNIVDNSFPKSSTQQSVPDTNWAIKLPNYGYDSGSNNYNISVSGLTDYTYDGTSMKVYNIKLGDYIAYRKKVPLQDKGTITPTISNQTISPDSGYDGISKVIVAGDADLVAGNIKKDVSIFGVTGDYEPPLEDMGTVTPSTEDQTIEPTGTNYGISKVIVAGDADLVAGNIKKDVTIFGVTGTYEATANLEDNWGTVTPGTSNQNITPHTNYDGMKKVVVAGDADLIAGNIKKDISIFGVTGIYEGYAEGMSDYYNSGNWARPSSLNNWQAMTPTENNSGSEKWFAISELPNSNLSAANIKKNVSIFGVTGSYDVPLEDNYGTVTPGTSSQDITPHTGYDGMKKVVVAGDADLIAGNIKKDVAIFGVTGTYEGSSPSIDPSQDINIGSYTNTSTEPSYGTSVTLMRDTILACINNHNWFSFKVTINGVSGQKYYKLNFTGN